MTFINLLIFYFIISSHMNDFQKTVNLKSQGDEERERREKPVKKKVKKVIKEKSRAEAIDQVYQDEPLEVEPQKEMHTISRPEIRPSYENLYKRVVMVLAFIIVVGAVYLLFFRTNTPAGEQVTEESNQWFAVKLVTDEVYYGQIIDISGDPVVIKNVYYNYDQLNPETEEEPSSTSNLRLVKRGKETHGPEGTMNIVRAQVIFMEPLKDDSKVLKAILDYEN